MSLSKNPFVNPLIALRENPSRKIQNGFEMLKANYRAEGRKITATNLAKAAGYENYGTANEQYGSFAHRICEIMDITPDRKREGKPIWTFGICDASEETDRHGHFQWILKNDVAAAAEEIGLVDPVPDDDLFADIEGEQEKLDQLSGKERDVLVKARIGQGLFRERLINHWEGCSVTGYANTDLLIASHIKPWRDCEDFEKIDVTNGLLLTPNIDRAFDRGFISFDQSGIILFSPLFSDEDAKSFGITRSMKLRWCFSQHENFLNFHRSKILRKTC